MKMLIVKIVEFVLVDRVPMLERKRKDMDAWLKQWTIPNNFKVIVGTAGERKRMENQLFAEAIKTGNLHGFDARNVRVTLSYVETSADGQFWSNESGIRQSFDLEDVMLATQEQS